VHSTAGASRVADERRARLMCADILRRERDYPIVGLSCRPGKRDPALAPEQVRDRIWPTAPIYIIEPRESRAINELLPDGLGAYNGAARIWMPGVEENSDPRWHPLIYDSTGVYGEQALERLAAEFPPRAPQRTEIASQEVAVLRSELDSARRRAESAERERDALERRLHALQQAGLDAQERLG
jgi:hypothetical protein